MNSLIWHSQSPDQTVELGQKFLSDFPKTSVVCLFGDLGSGKTHFVKGMGKALNLSSESIKSPTFVTLFEHFGKKTLYHCDFYRQENLSNFLLDWWNELLNRENSIVAVEWPERIAPHLPSARIDVTFEYVSDQERRLLIHPHRNF